MAIRQEAPRGGNHPHDRSLWLPETKQKELLQFTIDEYVKVTALTGIAGLWYVKQRYDALDGLTPSETELKAIKDGMDIYTNSVMERLLDQSKIRSNVKAGEGKKDGMPEIMGWHGAISGHRVDTIVDPIDGSSLLTKRLKEAVSFAAFSNKISDIQSVDYGVFLTVPPEAAQAADLSLTVEGHKKVLKNICDSLNIEPDELTQTMLNPKKPGREINHMFLQAALELGVIPDLIEAGDVMPSLHASLSRKQVEDFCNRHNLDPKKHGKPRIVVGRTAFVEKYGASNGSIVTGGASVGHKCHEDNRTVDTREKLTHKHFAPGDQDKTAVIATCVTASDLLGQQGITEQEDGSFNVSTFVLTAQDGARILNNNFDPREFALA